MDIYVSQSLHATCMDSILLVKTGVTLHQALDAAATDIPLIETFSHKFCTLKKQRGCRSFI